MVIITCIDDNNGIMFNHRRQSKDKKLREYILNLIDNDKLWMNYYSKKQFSDNDISQIIVDEDFLEKSGPDDYCFVEGTDIIPYIHKIEKIILFKWNRVYPSDEYFLLDMNGWTLEVVEDFVGHSHEKITKEIYRK